MNRIKENYDRISDDVAEHCVKAGRLPSEVRIIAVSKTVPLETVQSAVDAGITLLGESRIQEARVKLPALTGIFEAHMIGHLQSNKSKDAVRLFEMIQSIDSLDTARKVSAAASALNQTQKILLQVNSSGEDQKSGISPDEAVFAAGELLKIDNISLCGLMTIGPNTDNIKKIRESFAMTKKLLDKINAEFNVMLTVLSMGMSSDYHVAIEEGATMLRIGTAIFGERT